MPTIFIVSNAVSGDMQGAHLARKLLEIDPSLRILGSGGARMREAGVDVRVESDHLACVGIIASLRFLGSMRRTLERQKELIRADRPDLAILLDNEGTFNEMLAKFLQEQGIPIVHYFPPLVWLWGAWRARKIARHAHAIISAFPNEVPIYKKEGGRAFYFGHPLVDVVERAVKNHPLPAKPEKQIIGLMPGSRVHEAEMLTAPMIEAARQLHEKYPEVKFILPVAADFVRPILEREIARAGMQSTIRLVEEREYQSLRSCTAVVVAAGTATIELALMKIPMLVIYRLGPVTYEFVRRLIKTPFIAMPNILLGRRVVPELQQCGVTPKAIAAEMERLLTDTAYRADVHAGLTEMAEMLGPPGVLDRVAQFIVQEAASLDRFLQLPKIPYDAPMTPRPGGTFQQRLKRRYDNAVGWLMLPVDAAIWFVLEIVAERLVRDPSNLALVRKIGNAIIRPFFRSTREKMKLVLGPRRGSDEALRQTLTTYAEERGLGLAEPIIFSSHLSLARDMITIEGEDALRKALAQKRGVMFFLSHLGPMACVPAALGSHGYDITFTGTPMHRPYYEMKMRDMLGSARTYRGVIGDDLPRLARKAFARNGIFTAFIDYSVVDRHCLRVPLGEAETSVSLAPALIALRCKVPVIYVQCVRDTPTSYRLVLTPLALPSDTASVQTRAEDLTRRAFALLNADLVQRPEAWWVWDFAQIHPTGSESPASETSASRIYSHV